MMEMYDTAPSSEFVIRLHLELKDFSEHFHQKFVSRICTKPVKIERLGGTEWSIQLYPHGKENNEKHVWSYLTRECDGLSHLQIKVEFTFNFKSATDTFFMTDYKKGTFDMMSTDGFKVMTSETIVERIKSSGEDVLFVECLVKVKEYYSSPRRNFLKFYELKPVKYGGSSSDSD